jgi:hypothetical protein
MNTTPPLLPETTFKPLASAKLEAMITHAVSHQQLPREAQIIAFRPLQKLALGSGMAAMAASIMLAFMLTPQGSLTSVTTNTGTDVAASSELSDMILLESLGA